MKGHLRERPEGSGRWEMIVYLGRDPVTGKERTKSRTHRGGKRSAQSALAAFVVEVETGSRLVPTDKTVAWLLDPARDEAGQYVGVWLRAQEHAGLSPTTLRTYCGYIRAWLLPRLGGRSISSLTPGDLRDLRDAMRKPDLPKYPEGRSASTIRQVHHILRGALGFALEHEWVDRNVAAMRRPPRQEESEVAAPTMEEFLALLGACDPGSDLWTCIGLAAMLGARAGELCALRWSDIDLAGATVRIERSAFEAGATTGRRGVAEKGTKTRRSKRTLSIDEPTSDLLRARWAWQLDRRQRVEPGGALVADPYVLSRRSDGRGPPSPSALSRAVSGLRSGLGLPKHLHLHCLRHFMVTQLLDQGVPLPVASARAGHSSAAVTARVYAKAVAGRDVEAAAVLGRLLPRMPALPSPRGEQP